MGLFFLVRLFPTLDIIDAASIYSYRDASLLILIAAFAAGVFFFSRPGVVDSVLKAFFGFGAESSLLC